MSSSSGALSGLRSDYFMAQPRALSAHCAPPSLLELSCFSTCDYVLSELRVVCGADLGAVVDVQPIQLIINVYLLLPPGVFQFEYPIINSLINSLINSSDLNPVSTTVVNSNVDTLVYTNLHSVKYSYKHPNLGQLHCHKFSALKLQFQFCSDLGYLFGVVVALIFLLFLVDQPFDLPADKHDCGSIITSTVVQSFTITPSAGSNTSSHSTSHTGAIVGGVVGGVVGAIILVTLLWFICRRRRAKRDDFDGNFDPDRVVGGSARDGATLPAIDLAGADEVTPYSYSPAQQEMRQQADVPAFLAAGAAGAMSDRRSPPATSAPSQYSQSSDQGQGAYNVGAIPTGEFRHPSPGPSLAMTSSTHTGSTPPFGGVLQSAKEREAYRSGLQVSNPPEVVQHRDAGRLNATPEEEEAPAEIPPRCGLVDERSDCTLHLPPSLCRGLLGGFAMSFPSFTLASAVMDSPTSITP
ncbi:hypothetical protein SCP_0500350 [Sparassis crispa]|uniref:Uncharacterized protein n=1 Tax=Sparassis crispa TaxID=139825 RepID=A0A401GLG2_9APHY|nr:hypothetical protein SCP_0500350 [Sparassis crispa]GBE82992.1 hypothetical protein SCP_0500350 [Sparassis crispa]